MKSWFSLRVVAVSLLSLCSTALLGSAQTVPVVNPGFGPMGGRISGTLDLNALNAAPASITQQLGTSGWYGRANATTALTLGFRPSIEVDDASSAGAGYIDYDLGASLGSLVGLEMPDAYLWQPLTGWSLAANTTYTFSIDMEATSLLNASALSSRGFGIGMTVGSTASTVGTFVADTISNSSLLSLTLLGGNLQRLTMTFTTGAVPPVGDIGIAAFAGRGVQTLQLSLLDNYRLDNAAVSYAAVPEPSTPIVLLSGLGVLVLTRPRRPRLQG